MNHKVIIYDKNKDILNRWTSYSFVGFSILLIYSKEIIIKIKIYILIKISKFLQKQKKMLNYNKLNIFKKLYYGLKSRTNIFYDKFRFYKMRQFQKLYDLQTNKYDSNLSYRYCWFDLQHEKNLAQWDNITDVINGGQSTAEFWYDKQNKCVKYQGYVETKDKQRMIFYPFINLTRTFPSYVKLGPMKLIQVQVKTDGKPIEVNFLLKSFIKGQVSIYGFLLSKSTDWHTYEIPLENMILRGTQQDYHQGSPNISGHQNQYLSKSNQSSIFDKEFQSVKKILRTQILDDDAVQLSNIGFRLVSTQSENRCIQIRRVNFAYKKGYDNFAESYKSPYFYIVDDKIQKVGDVGLNMGSVQFLNSSLQNVELIDTGDIKYYRSNKKQRKNTKIL